MLPTEALSRVGSSAAIIGLGVAARALGGVQREDGGALLRLIFNVTLPAVLLTSFATLPIGSGAGSAAVVAVAVAQATLLFAASFAWDSRPPRLAALLAGATQGVNLGLFAYPLVVGVWGEAGLQTVVLFDLANQGVLLMACYVAFFARAAAPGASAARAILRRLANPCFVALYGAVLLRATGTAVPAPLATLSASLAAANRPLALLALGMLLDIRLPREQLASVAAVLGLRLSVSLALAAAAATLLGGLLSSTALAVVCVALTSPIAMLTLSYAAEFSCDVALAAMLVNTSNVVSFAMLCAVLQITTVAPHVLAPAAAAGSFVAAVIAVLASASAERQRASSTGTVAAARASGAMPRGRMRKSLRHCERMALPVGLRVLGRGKALLAVSRLLNERTHAPPSLARGGTASTRQLGRSSDKGARASAAAASCATAARCAIIM